MIKVNLASRRQTRQGAEHLPSLADIVRDTRPELSTPFWPPITIRLPTPEFS
ncbi:MAG TPA: hypothetical protein VJ301_18420 [Propionibacteriaceae bacterium]|nr:hypothetical protein [Propionibacteriaceae bacterium]